VQVSVPLGDHDKARTFSLPDLSRSNYELLLANFATQNESLSAQVVLSSSGCPAASSAAIDAEARAPRTSSALTEILSPNSPR
jgi:hypothetical protein